MNLTDEQRNLIIEALRNDAVTMNAASTKVGGGSAYTILRAQADERIALASKLDRADFFEWGIGKDVSA